MQEQSAGIGMNKLVWLGVRESDTARTEESNYGFPGFFASVTLFGSGKNGNHAMEKVTGRRIDHNGECEGFEEFFLQTMEEMSSKDPALRFFAYDVLDYSMFPKHLQEKFIGNNDYHLLEQLDHKLYTREHYSGIVKVPPYFIMSAEECSLKKIKCLFPDRNQFVLQRDYSCGGSGTYLISCEDPSSLHESHQDSSDEHLNSCLINFLPDDMKSDEKVLISPYYERNVSVNIHCMIYPEEILLFAPSLQLIDEQHGKLAYIGSDFSATKQLDEGAIKKIRGTAEKVCRDLQSRGYRGVCGIDMILAEGECFFMEVNARFQASSMVLNKDLQSRDMPTLPEYHLDAFFNDTPTLPIPPANAEGSFITLHYHKDQQEELHWLWERASDTTGFDIIDDAIDWDGELEENCYAFQIHCPEQISSITFQNTIRIHPNVRPTSFCITGEKSYDNILRLKLLMLSRGVRVTEKAWELAGTIGGMDWYEFDAVTLKLWDEIWVTAPCMEKWASLSPLDLDADTEKKTFWLSRCGDRLVPVEVMRADPHAAMVSSGGHAYGDIVYRNPDRLRVYHRDGCIFQEQGLGCRFCDLVGTGKALSFAEIREAVDLYWDNLDVDHFLIGGGSGPSEEEYESVVRIAEYIHSHSNKHIYLMSTPVKDLGRLRRLRDCGITEVSFNIEIFDRDIARRVMPGKSMISEEFYMESLKKAAGIFGATGEVRCAVVVGFDDPDCFARGIRRICEAGAAPILSLYRLCPGTELENYMPLSEKEALMYYNIANEVSRRYGLKPGPACKACQNNTLALDI